MSKIFTFDGKGNGILPLLKDFYELSIQDIHDEISQMHKEMLIALKENNVEYNDLKSALVPNHKKEEIGFLFDSSKINETTYGYEILGNIFPLLEKETTQSILIGDLIGRDKSLIIKIVKHYIKSNKTFDVINSRNIFCVYVNNMTGAMLSKIQEQLNTYKPYLGYIPATYSSPAKAYLSTILCNGCLKNKTNIILGHENDRPDTENVNLGAPAFEENGYQVISIKGKHFDHFLNYKIQSSLPHFHEVENYFSINLLTHDIVNLDKLNIELDRTKHEEYLLKVKLDKMKKAELNQLSKVDLSLLIKEKIQLGYIYNLEYQADYNTYKFNIMIEVKRNNGSQVQLTVVVEYQFEKHNLRIITLY